jgi:hypothetical protein
VKKPEKAWNPRYVEYARAHEREPAAMLEHDTKRFPGGKMAGFMIWMNERWTEWAKLKGFRRTASGSQDTPITEELHAEFDTWLRVR